MDALDRLAHAGIETIVQAGHDAETLGTRQIGRFLRWPHPHRIDAVWFLDEDVFAGIDGGPEVLRMKARGASNQDDIARLDHVPIALEARERVVGVDQDSGGCVRLDLVPGLGEPIREGIGHRDEMNAGIGVEGVDRGAGAAPPAAAEANTDVIAAGREDPGRSSEPGQRRRQAGGKFQEITARGRRERARIGWGGHGDNRLTKLAEQPEV